MRVLYVIDSLASSGGAERSLAAMAPYLVRRDVELAVAYLHERPGLHDRLREAGAETFNLEGRRAGATARIARLAKAQRPDLVHTTLFEADVSGRLGGVLARVPTVTSLVNTSYGPEHVHDPMLRPWKVRAAQALDAVTARTAVRFHANSAHVADVMAKRLWIPRSRIDVVPRGRDPDALGCRTAERAERVRASLGIAGTVPLVVAAARHERQKGLDVLVAALPAVAKEVPEALLLIAGREGNQTAALHESVSRLGIGRHVRFLGPRDDVPDLLSIADVLVAPSRWEGLPGLLIEALALEAPIVASDLPSVREVVQFGGDVVARLVPPDQPSALADAIIGTLSSSAQMANTALRGRALFMGRFTIAHTVDLMIQFYEGALNSNARPAS